MDKLDYKILHELLRNSRESLSKIAKSVKLSRENVHYRIKRLVEQNIIREYVTDIDVDCLGFSQYTLFLKYSKLSTARESDLFDFLHNHKAVSWVGPLAGKWSLTFDVSVSNSTFLDDFIKQLYTKFDDELSDYLALEKVNQGYYFHKILGAQIVHPEVKKDIHPKCDSVDLDILKHLNLNAQMTYTKLGEQVTLTSNAVKERYLRLKKTGLIRGHSISLNHKAFGYEWHGIQLKIIRHHKDVEKNLIHFFEAAKEVVFQYQYAKSGLYDFDIGIIVKNSQELRNFINTFRNKFADEVEIHDMFVVLDEESSHRLPDVVFTNT